ncbi:MAG: sugar transferase [Bacteroidales bacterium]|nr:sugar transferase [Bacteroidales bacterium]
MTKVIRQKKDFNSLFSVLDIVFTVISYFLAYFLTDLFYTEYFTFTWDYWAMLGLIIPTWIILLYTSNLASIPQTRSHLTIFMSFVNFSFIGFALLFLYKHIFNLQNFSHYVIVSFSLINLIVLYSFRMITFRVFKNFRANGRNVSNIILYADEKSEKLIESIIEHKEWGFRILMIISDSAWIRKRFGDAIRIYPDKINIKNILDFDIIDEVVYSKSIVTEEKIRDLVETCEEIGVTLRIQANSLKNMQSGSELMHLEQTPFITVKNTPRNRHALAWKSFSDFWISFIIIFFASPIMLFIAITIKLTSKGPIIFRQERVGLRGRKFYIYKFRTMVQNAEALKAQLEAMNESDGPTFKIKHDPRITTIGRILRKTGLDELPQLFNVLKGEMSLIGPRPPLPSEVEKYERWHLRRLSVKPGITCTWQIIPNRNEVVFDNWMKLDIQYIENWSVKKDLQLFFKTIKTVIYGTGY